MPRHRATALRTKDGEIIRVRKNNADKVENRQQGYVRGGFFFDKTRNLHANFSKALLSIAIRTEKHGPLLPQKAGCAAIKQTPLILNLVSAHSQKSFSFSITTTGQKAQEVTVGTNYKNYWNVIDPNMAYGRHFYIVGTKSGASLFCSSCGFRRQILGTIKDNDLNVGYLYIATLGTTTGGLYLAFTRDLLSPIYIGFPSYGLPLRAVHD